jgi:hypothetical protein
MTPTTLALQMPVKSKEESISSLNRTRPHRRGSLRSWSLVGARGRAQDPLGGVNQTDAGNES